MRKIVFLLLTVLSCNAFGQEVAQSVVDRSAAIQDHINFLHQREWVRLNEKGIISGRLSVLNESGQTEDRIGATVVVSRDGQAILETTTAEGGAFELSGLQPGTYAIQCRGDYTFAAYALHVLPNNATHLAADLEIYASVIPQQRAAELLAGDMVPSDLQSNSAAYYRNFEKDPIAKERQFNNSPQVVLRDGTLVGRVSRPGWTFGEQDLTGTVAQIVQDGQVVGKTAVGRDGYYAFKGVKPGVYSLFVNGDDGFAVLAFEAVAADQPVASAAGLIRMVSADLIASDCLCCEMIQVPEINACSACAPIAPLPVVDQVVAVAEPCGCGLPVGACGCGAAPACGGGYAGGFGGGIHGGFGRGLHGGGGGGGLGGGGGGGGLGGGLGGIGGLLGIAGLAVGVTALADEDEGFNVNPATPIN